MKKKHYLLAAAFLAAMGLQAQNHLVVSAYNYMRDGNLEKAVEAIEPTISSETTSNKEKTWRYRGDVYRLIVMGTDEALKAKFPDALDKAVDSYLKANELDTKGSYRQENDQWLQNLQIVALNSGNDAFNEEHYDQAVARYLQSERIAKAMGRVDTNAMFNSALAYEFKGDKPQALQRYRECLDLGYDKPELYRYMATLQRADGDLDGAIATTQKGVARYPAHEDLRLDLLTYLQEAGREQELMASVNEGIKADPSNPVLYSILGSLCSSLATPREGEVSEEDMLKWYGKAEEAYLQSIKLDPNGFDSYYNIGVLYNNRAAYELDKCNQIKDGKSYDACREKVDEIFVKGIPYFEKAHELKPEDRVTMQQLKVIYAKSGDEAKYNAIKKELGE